MLRSAILTGSLALAFVQAAAAQPVVLYTTNFNSPTYTDGPLNNVDPNSTTAPGQDNWLNTSSGATGSFLNPISVSNTATNGIVSLTTNGQDVRRQFTAVNSGSVFFDADVTVTAAQAAGDYALHFTDGGTSAFFGRTFIRSSGTGFQLGISRAATVTNLTYGTTVLPFNTPLHLLVRYDLVPGLTNDTAALYVNPSTMDGSTDTPYATAFSEGTDATSIAAIGLRQGALANSATLTVDNLRVFSEAAVPEPSSLALLGVAGVAAAVRRRKKAAV